MSSAWPATSTRAPERIGRTEPSFFSSTSDLRTASRARARWAGEPSSLIWPSTGRLSLNRPVLTLTRRMRRTASSRRAIGISPDFTWARVEAYSGFQLSGAMNMSIPALKARAQLSFEQPGSWPCAFQSDTTKPSKPSGPRSTSVRMVSLPECLTPFQLEKLAMIDSTPASMAWG